MSKVPSPNCETCMTTEDVYHVIMECISSEMLRQQILDFMCSRHRQQHPGQTHVQGGQDVVKHSQVT